jgi:hypothetical protein
MASCRWLGETAAQAEDMQALSVLEDRIQAHSQARRKKMPFCGRGAILLQASLSGMIYTFESIS